MAALICARSSGLGLRAPRVAAIPPATPIIPRALPSRAVLWLERPARAPTQHRPEPKYIIWWEDETKWKKGVEDKDWAITGWKIIKSFCKWFYLEGPVQHLHKQRAHLEVWRTCVVTVCFVPTLWDTKHSYTCPHLFNVVSRLQSSSIASNEDTTG